MKKIGLLLGIVLGMNAMGPKGVVIKQEDQSHSMRCSLGCEYETIEIDTKSELSCVQEALLLNGVGHFLSHLSSGRADLTKLEQEVARAHGYENTQFTHSHLHVSQDDEIQSPVELIELKFKKSKTAICNPFTILQLPHEQPLNLKTNLKDKSIALAFVADMLHPEIKEENSILRTVNLAVLEDAILDEIRQKSSDE